MTYKEYEQFVINYKPFEWETRDYDFRETMRSKHNFIISYIRFYKVNFHKFLRLYQVIYTATLLRMIINCNIL